MKVQDSSRASSCASACLYPLATHHSMKPRKTFLKTPHFTGYFTCQTKIRSDDMESFLAIESDMRGIAAVVPIGKAAVVGLKVGHKRQQTAWLQQPDQARELRMWLVKMFRHFGAGDKVKMLIKHCGVWKKNGSYTCMVCPALASISANAGPGPQPKSRPTCLGGSTASNGAAKRFKNSR